MIKFNTRQLTNQKIDQYINIGVNVLLIGRHGVGKTTKILDGFKRNHLKYMYFSASTLDPWVHLIGVPKAKTGKDGLDYLDFILPKGMDDDLEAIMIDEWNRSPSVVKNALMELLQFKQINGRKFPKLKMIWAAINPPKSQDDESGDYDAEEMDLAQLDRFQVIIELPYEPDKKYFNQKYGTIKGRVLTDWWKKQSDESKKILSPRRLDYIGEYFLAGGDVSDLLPASANASELVKNLSIDEEDVIFNQVFNDPNETVIKKFFSDDKNYMKYINKFDDPKYYKYFHLIKPEFVNQKIKEDENFRYYAIAQVLADNTFYTCAVEEIEKHDETIQISKVVNIIKIQNQGDLKNLLTLDDVGNNVKALSPLPKGGGGQIEVGADWLWQNFQPNSITNPALDRPHLKTLDYRRYFKMLMGSYKNESIYVFLHVMLGAYKSMQEGTLKGESNFIPLFNAAMVRTKTELTPLEVKKVREFINNNCKDKLGLKTKILSYLKSDMNQISDVTPVHPKLKDVIDKAVSIVNYI